MHGETPVPESLAQAFPCEFCEIFKNSFFYRAPPVAASEIFPSLTFINLQKKQRVKEL